MTAMQPRPQPPLPRPGSLFVQRRQTQPRSMKAVKSTLTALDLPLRKHYFADIFLISESLSVTDIGNWNSALPSILSSKTKA